MPTSTAKAAAPAEPEQIRRRATVRGKTRAIPASQVGRVRALTSHGMTQEQVAELYGVTVEEIERVFRPQSVVR
jgi:hypothetical protein